MSAPQKTIAVIGGGPAGLMAAEVLSQAGIHVDVYDAMPSVGRKFLMAGKGGMNITHAEPLSDFIKRYGARQSLIEPLLNAFPPEDLREWIHSLGIATFVGTSNRVFPSDMKAAPLLRAWLHRLREHGVQFHMRHRWVGWDDDGRLCFSTQTNAETNPLQLPLFRGRTEPTPPLKMGGWEGFKPNDVDRVSTRDIGLKFDLRHHKPDAVILALGGGSWPQLGSDGAWVSLLEQHGAHVAPLRPSNCGFDVAWSDYFKQKFVGEPLKSVTARFGEVHKQGECLITTHGIEGGLIYALSAPMRDEIARAGNATLHLDLLPAWSAEKVLAEVSHPRGSRSLSSHLQSRLGLKGVKANLLREVLSVAQMNDAALLAATIKAVPLRLIAPRPLSEAISSAGGVTFEALDGNLMIKKSPGLFCAGEMLDWEAPTGGYLLTGCFASGRAAGLGALVWLNNKAN